MWLIDSTPVECGRSRPTAKRSDLAGWAGYGYCASHSRYFWGLRLHLICTPAGLPITFALDQPQDRRTRSRPRPARDRTRAARPPSPARPSSPTRATPVAEFETFLAGHGARLLRPAFQQRTTPARRPAPQTAPPDHRVGQRHPQRPTRPRTPRRPHLRRSRRPSTPTPPRPDRRHLAQRTHPPTRTAIPHRLRPLTPKPPGILWASSSPPCRRCPARPSVRMVRRRPGATLRSRGHAGHVALEVGDEHVAGGASVPSP